MKNLVSLCSRDSWLMVTSPVPGGQRKNVSVQFVWSSVQFLLLQVCPDRLERGKQERGTFKDTEKWRRQLLSELYANMTDEDWDTAPRWKSYAYPFEANRSCVLGYYEPLQHYESLAALRDTWIDSTMSELQIKTYESFVYKFPPNLVSHVCTCLVAKFLFPHNKLLIHMY